MFPESPSKQPWLYLFQSRKMEGRAKVAVWASIGQVRSSTFGGYSKTCLATPWLSISSAKGVDLVCENTRRPYISPWRVSFLFANREIRNGTGNHLSVGGIV